MVIISMKAIVLCIPHTIKKLVFVKQPQLIWDYPLNLSILMRGGKETNKDFLSSGERKEISSALSHFVFMANVRCSVWNVHFLV